MYDRVLDQVRDLHLLFDLAEEISPRFALVESVLIPCIVAAIRKNIGREIFSAGRPDELHKVSPTETGLMQNYTLTTKFIDQIESFAPSSSAVLSIRASSEISLLQRQWQLPVYFQLRWKDITAKLERWLEQPPPDPQWLIPQTAGVFEAVELCWSDNVFIPDLADRFWRLTLQVSLCSNTLTRSYRDIVVGWPSTIRDQTKTPVCKQESVPASILSDCE